METQVTTSEPQPPKQSTESTEPTVITNAHGIEIHKGRWGWHPCSHKTYAQLKHLHKLVWTTYLDSCRNDDFDFTAAEHRRWVWRRNPNGRYEPPPLFPHYHKVWGEDGTSFTYVRTEVEGAGVRMNHLAGEIVDAFRQARTVYQDPDEILVLHPLCADPSLAILPNTDAS